MTTKEEHALIAAQRGFAVFRLKKNEKTPFADGWQNEATTDPATIRKLFHNHDFNIGIAADGSKDFVSLPLVIVDVDTKDGKQGNTTLNNLAILGNELPATLTAFTASGGKHLFYYHDHPVSGGANKLGLNVDIKSRGGYVVGAGSTIDGKAYVWANDSHVQPCPPWVLNLCKPTEKKTTASHVPLDTPQALTRAKLYLSEAPIATAGQGGNHATFKVAAHLRDLGVSQYSTEELLHTYYNSRCNPPWLPGDLHTIIANAYSYSQNSPGILSPHAEFTPIPDEPLPTDPFASTDSKNPLHYELPEDITTTLDTEPLIEDLLDEDAISIFYGDSNTGKTFIALDLAYHISTGAPYFNKRTLQGAVVYVASEGGRSARNRISALKTHYNTNKFPLALVPCQIDLYSNHQDMQALIDLTKQAQQKIGQVRLTVIDTLSRALAGANENDSEAMGKFIKNITLIRQAIKGHLLIVHHSGKDATKGARGHSLLRAAVDTEVHISPDTLTITKQRDMAIIPPIGFDLNRIVLGTNRHGKEITSCTVSLCDASLKQDFDAQNRMDKRDYMAYQALKDCKTGRKLREFENVVDQTVWAQCCKDFDFTMIEGAKPWPKSDGSFNTAFKRVRDRLTTFGKVEEVAEKQWAVLE